MTPEVIGVCHNAVTPPLVLQTYKISGGVRRVILDIVEIVPHATPRFEAAVG